VLRVQCPNCGKEAINVNGKYVCLDCGVEITAAPTTPTPTISNHDMPAGSPATEPAVPVVDPVAVATAPEPPTDPVVTTEPAVSEPTPAPAISTEPDQVSTIDLNIPQAETSTEPAVTPPLEIPVEDKIPEPTLVVTEAPPVEEPAPAPEPAYEATSGNIKTEPEEVTEKSPETEPAPTEEAARQVSLRPQRNQRQNRLKIYI
jgi:DNA polymerase-3 subunit gamma/tau